MDRHGSPEVLTFAKKTVEIYACYLTDKKAEASEELE